MTDKEREYIELVIESLQALRSNHTELTEDQVNLEIDTMLELLWYFE